MASLLGSSHVVHLNMQSVISTRGKPVVDPCVAPCCRPSGLAGRHIAQAQLMQSCLAAVKASMLVMQRSQESISTALQAEQSGCKLEETLSSLLGCYTHILSDGKEQDM